MEMRQLMKSEFETKIKIINLLIDSGFKVKDEKDGWVLYAKKYCSLSFGIADFKMCIMFVGMSPDDYIYHWFKDDELFYIVLGYIAELYYIVSYPFPLKSIIE